MNRIMNLLLSLLIFTLISPFFLITAFFLLVSQQSIIFKQKRIGYMGKEFILYKFKTMSGTSLDLDGIHDVKSINRVTKVGKILRKYKFDEIPQLINVIKGDMNLVGPRPEVRYWVEKFKDEFKKINSVMPGITDPASLFFSDEETFLSVSDDPEKTYIEEIMPRKIEIYLNYIQRRSFFYDLKILIASIIFFLFGKYYEV